MTRTWSSSWKAASCWKWSQAPGERSGSISSRRTAKPYGRSQRRCWDPQNHRSVSKVCFVRGAWGEPGPLWRVWSSESWSFIPPVTHTLSDAGTSGTATRTSVVSGMVTLPKLMNCCLRLLWGGLCWSQQPCLVCFLPKLFRSLRCLSPNAECEMWYEHLWCGTWLLHLSCLQPQGKVAFQPHKGTAEMWKSKGW